MVGRLHCFYDPKSLCRVGFYTPGGVRATHAKHIEGIEASGMILWSFMVGFIAQNGYCTRDIYLQFTKALRSVILRAVMLRRYECPSTIGCQECTTMLINMM